MTYNEGKEKLATALLKPVNPFAIILLGIFTLIWGFWVGNPFWDVFATAQLFSFMNFIPEVVWGLIALAAGVVIIYGVLNRAVSALMLGAKTGALFWCVIAIMYFLGDWHNTGGITAGLLATYSGFIYLNLKINRDHVDECDLFI